MITKDKCELCGDEGIVSYQPDQDADAIAMAWAEGQVLLTKICTRIPFFCCSKCGLSKAGKPMSAEGIIFKLARIKKAALRAACDCEIKPANYLDTLSDHLNMRHGAYFRHGKVWIKGVSQ